MADARAETAPPPAADVPAATDAAAAGAAQADAAHEGTVAPAGAEAAEVPDALLDAATDASSADSAAAAAEPAPETQVPQDPPSLLSSAAGDTPDAPAPEGLTDAETATKPTSEGEKAKEGGEDQAAKAEEAEPDPAETDATPEIEAPALSIDDFVLPDGVDRASQEAQRLVEIVNDRELTLKDRTQALLDLHKAEIERVHQAYAQQQRQVWGELNQGWQNELRNDPEIGGNRLHTNLSLAKGVIEHFLSPQDSSALLRHADANGMGNFLPFIRLLARMGRASQIFEDGLLIAPEPPAKPQRGPGNRGWYDNTKFSNGSGS